MTRWFNFGVEATSDEERASIVEVFEERGLVVYCDRDTVVKATENARDIDEDEVLAALDACGAGIERVVVIEANDTADTASATFYEPESSGGFDIVRTDHSGGQNSRRDWILISGNLRVTGGKYY